MDNGAEVNAGDGTRGSTPLWQAITKTGAGGTSGRGEEALVIGTWLPCVCQKLVPSVRMAPSEDRDETQERELCCGCHVLDLMPYLLGRVIRVSAFKTRGAEDAYSVNMVFENGAAGNLSVSNCRGVVCAELAICGSNGGTIKTQNSIFMQACTGGQPFARNRANCTMDGEANGEQGT